MAILQIDNDPTLTYYDELVQLESLEYLLEFAWSDRESAWYLNIYDQDANPLAVGIKLVLNVDLLRRFKDSRLPPGKLICMVAGGDSTDPTQSSDLGDRVLLMYITSDDEVLATTAATTSPTASESFGATKSISISPSSTSIVRGSGATLTATASPSGANVSSSSTWTTSNASVATVDSSGNVTAVAVGAATITAMYGDLLTANAYVTVTPSS